MHLPGHRVGSEEPGVRVAIAHVSSVWSICDPVVTDAGRIERGAQLAAPGAAAPFLPGVPPCSTMTHYLRLFTITYRRYAYCGPTEAGMANTGFGQEGVSPYLPIAEHGLIGDLRSVALVGTNGTIDWYCCPRFDSPSVFASILDADRGGSFELAADVPAQDQAVLLPRHQRADHPVLRRGRGGRDPGLHADRRRPARGRPAPADPAGGLRPRHRCRSAPGWRPASTTAAAAAHRAPAARRTARLRVAERLTLALTASVPLEMRRPGRAVARSSSHEGESAVFALDRVGDGVEPRGCPRAEAEEQFAATVAFWRHWLSASRYRGRWREMVHRSALTLKLLTYAPTGAIVAAPTTSLPEQIGGERNWDYRYVWVRDAAFCVYALLRLGFTEEAEAFMGFLSEHVSLRGGGPPGPLQIMYGIDGRSELPERELAHLEGYRGSAPVRVGNAAADQLQLDIYGALIDSVYLYDKWGTAHLQRPLGRGQRAGGLGLRPLGPARRGHLGDPRRAQELPVLAADVLGGDRTGHADGQPARPARRHAPLAAEPATRSTGRSCSAAGPPSGRRSSSTSTSDVLDASVLMMPLAKFISPTDPKWLVHPRRARPTDLVSDSLVYRYDPEASPDGLRGRGGHVLDLLVLVRRGARPRRPPGRGPAGLREDAHLRQPPRPVRRGDRAHRRAARQLPAGLHPPRPDQRRVQPRPRPRLTGRSKSPQICTPFPPRRHRLNDQSGGGLAYERRLARKINL